MEKLERMQYLIDEINKHNYNYYTLLKPTISDAEYDKLYYELVDLEKELNLVLDGSPTQRVGNEVLTSFKKREHSVRLYSLDKVRSFMDLEKWTNDMKEFSPNTKFVLEYKFDGLQLVLHYNDGKFVEATTRGNGIVGEDVTIQVKTIKSVPLTIPYKGDLIVQGEGMITQTNLKKYNETATETLKNARNGVAGAIRNLDPKETAKRNLDFFCYSILRSEKSFETQKQMHEFLIENKFLVGDYFKLLSSFDEIKTEIESIDKIKTELDVMIDGMVIKIDDCTVREDIGYTNKFPKWAMAYKFEAQEMSTILNDVVWQVGRTGKVTPIAVLQPTNLAGATISRATLNNMDDIIKKGVKIGSRVLIRRSNEVIPEVLGIIEDLPNSIEIKEPKVCPCCGSTLIKKGPLLYCLNRDGCTEQVVDRLTHFSSRDAMNIEGLSNKTILQMHKNLSVSEPSDLYKLSKEDILKLEKTKDKKATNLFESIQKSKQISLSKFVYALGISEVGIKTARDLANYYQSYIKLKNATNEELEKINDIGSVIADNIVEYFADEKNISEVQKLFDLGVVIENLNEESKVDSILTNKKVVLTGGLDFISRKDAEEKIIRLGGIPTSSVSKATDIVIVGENPGSKFEKAKELNIQIMSAEEFEKLIEKHGI